MSDNEHRRPVIVLAGGASRRMGTDKRLVEIDGVPMLHRVIDRLEGASRVLVVVDPARPLPDGLGADPDRVVIADLRTGAGPLAGLEAGLSTSLADPIVFVVGTDMPWIAPEVLRLLAARLVSEPAADLACLLSDGRRQPLPVACRPAPLLRRVTGLLDAGERRLRRLLDHPHVVALAEPDWRLLDPTGDSVRDIDTPADLALAR